MRSPFRGLQGALTSSPLIEEAAIVQQEQLAGVAQPANLPGEEIQPFGPVAPGKRDVPEHLPQLPEIGPPGAYQPRMVADKGEKDRQDFRNIEAIEGRLLQYRCEGFQVVKIVIPVLSGAAGDRSGPGPVKIKHLVDDGNLFRMHHTEKMEQDIVEPVPALIELYSVIDDKLAIIKFQPRRQTGGKQIFIAGLADLHYRSGKDLVGKISGLCHLPAEFGTAAHGDGRFVLPNAAVKGLDPQPVCQVVMVKKGQVAPLGEENPPIADPARATVDSIQLRSDPRIPGGQLLQQLRRAVGRAVIDTENFQVFIRLTTEGSEGLREEFPGIIKRNDNRDQWTVHHTSMGWRQFNGGSGRTRKVPERAETPATPRVCRQPAALPRQCCRYAVQSATG